MSDTDYLFELHGVMLDRLEANKRTEDLYAKQLGHDFAEDPTRDHSAGLERLRRAMDVRDETEACIKLVVQAQKAAASKSST